MLRLRSLAHRRVFTLLVLAPSFALPAFAVDPSDACLIDKMRAAGAYGTCRLKAEAKAVKSGATADTTRCDENFSRKWSGAESKGGAECPVLGDSLEIGAMVSTFADDLADTLVGRIRLNHRMPATGQTVSYGEGDDGDLRPGAPLAYRENGDGTVTDRNTGLMWEKKFGEINLLEDVVVCTDESGTCANPHHVSNAYSWSDGSSPQTDLDGTVVTIFLAQLNNRCSNDPAVACTTDNDCAMSGGKCGFAGHRDWRLPSLKELQGIVHLERMSPSVDAPFSAGCGPFCTDVTSFTCSCTVPWYYWTSTTYAPEASSAWVIDFSDGSTFTGDKSGATYVRAVRASQ